MHQREFRELAADRSGTAGPLRRMERPVKTLYGCAIVLWLVSGVGLHVYFSRAAQRPAAVEEKRDLYLRQFENDETVAQRIRETHWTSSTTMAGGFAAWVVVGVLLAIPGVRAL